MTATRPTRVGRSPRRRVAFWAGVAMLTAGAVLLGYVAWQLYGTDIVARRRQEAAVERLRTQWPTQVASGAEGGAARLGEAFALVRVPRFGEDYVMPVHEGTSDDVLSRGLGHFADTAGPGRQGNFALAGHRITHGEPLRRMPELRPGDEIQVETRQAVYTYVLGTDPNDLVVPFTAGWVLDPFPVNPDGGVQPDPSDGDRLITVTTCSELFNTDDRMVAFGHLEAAEPKSR